MIKHDKPNTLPAYSSLIYGDIYNNLQKSIARDSNWSANLRTFFQYNKLVNAVLNEIRMNQSLLQLGLVFGNLIDLVAQRIGAYGQYDILDINGLQISRCQEKYGSIYPAMKIFEQNAAKIDIKNQYDVVLCFMLLQELPPATKAKVINNALNAVKPGGFVIFVDYHKPNPWHPLRYFVRMYNRLRNPFVEKLWDRDIDTFAKNKSQFLWRKSLYFGGMFQKVVATKKTSPIDEILAMQAKSKENDFFLPDF